MIIGLGIDMIEVARIQRSLEHTKIGRRFRDRVYTEKEIAYCERRERHKYESYAGRFAVKEAGMKALGQGWGAKVGWLDIEVLSLASGEPTVVLHNKASSLAQELGIQHIAVSITHTKHHAMATLIAEGERVNRD
ncbi:MAG: holo-ACP synthase [Candidatus Binatia bacterium]|jgi:holo-[acyl-carrier protein] synthase